MGRARLENDWRIASAMETHSTPAEAVQVPAEAAVAKPPGSAAARAAELVSLAPNDRRSALEAMSIEEQVAILRCMPLEDCQDCLAAMSEEDKAEISESMQQSVQGETPSQAAHNPAQATEAQLLNMQTERADALRQTLTDYYKQHAPEEIAKVENLVARVVGGPPSEVGGMVVGGVLWEEENSLVKSSPD